MAKAGSAYIDIDADLTKFRSAVGKATANLRADLDLDVDRLQVTSQLVGLSTNLRLDIDRTDITTQLAMLGVSVNVQPDYSTLMSTRIDIIAYLSGIWVDINVRLDATTLASLQAQLAALSAQAGSLGGGAAAAGGAAGMGVGALATGVAVGVGGAAAIGATAILGLGAYGANIAAENELAEVSFTRLLGSEQAALDYLQQLRDFAAATPFDFPGIRDSAARFLAVGVEADRVIPIMTTLGDATAAMGTGADGINRATTALLQMSQKGIVSADNMLQLTDAGIPAWDALASVLGTDVAGAMDMVTKKQVPAEKMFEAIEQKSGKAFERVSGGMADASQTMSGLLATLKDDMDATLGEIMEPFIPLLKDMIPVIKDTLVPLFRDHLAPAIERSLPLVATLMEAFSPFMGLFIDFAAGLAESLQPALDAMMPMLVDLAAQLGPKMEEIFPHLAEAFIALADAFVEMAPFIPPLLDFLTGITVAHLQIFTGIAEAFAWMAGIFADPLATLLGEVVSLFGDLITLDWDGAVTRVEGWINSIQAMLPGLVNAMMNAWNSIDWRIDVDLPSWLGGFSYHGDLIPDANWQTLPPSQNTGPAKSFSGALAKNVGTIPKHHDGGMFRAPFGQSEGLALLRNNEVVFTPEQMSALSASGGSSRPIEVPVYLDGRQIARAATRGHYVEEMSTR